MKLVRHIRWLLLAVVVVAAASTTMHWKRAHDPVVFVDHWGDLFHQHSTPEAFKTIAPGDRPDLIYQRLFDSGEWIAARTEYSCTDGAGFDATVFLDSRGSIRYQIGHHFCAYEGLSGDLNKVEANSLAEFYSKLTNVELRVWGGHTANKITRANAGGPPRLPIRTRWAARIAQFRRWAESPAPRT
jgi:hypothetical protein